jgi:hypothetical protein
MAEQVNEEIGCIIPDQVMPGFADIIAAKRIRAAGMDRPRLPAAPGVAFSGPADLLTADYRAVKRP